MSYVQYLSNKKLKHFFKKKPEQIKSSRSPVTDRSAIGYFPSIILYHIIFYIPSLRSSQSSQTYLSLDYVPNMNAYMQYSTVQYTGQTVKTKKAIAI